MRYILSDCILGRAVSFYLYWNCSDAHELHVYIAKEQKHEGLKM